LVEIGLEELIISEATNKVNTSSGEHDKQLNWYLKCIEIFH
jgi:hypothetical protein